MQPIFTCHDSIVLRYSSAESPLLQELRQETMSSFNEGASRMISGLLQGHILSVITSITNVKSALELGTFTGYATICIAQGMQGRKSVENLPKKVYTCEIDNKSADIASKYFTKGDLTDMVSVVNLFFHRVFILFRASNELYL